jgi:hypothetical protein
MPLIVAAWVAIAAGVGYLAVTPEPPPKPPRFAYADHVYGCQSCGRLMAPLCPEGERLRVAARDHDGVRDPALDR